MRLRIFLPHTELLDTETVKIKAENPMGYFTLKPRHIDMTSTLVPGILSYTTSTGKTEYLAVDYGLLVKQGDMVKVVSRRAFLGELGKLEAEVRRMTEIEDERERSARSAVARLEADFVRRFLEVGRS
ncbi:F0F1 ATP synthase subunit epsilon [Halodesulfovibrio aestuarii]|uniref:F0F1 ATP synthase subunit epsilon n=1 Tax=Halodesulfovibrio aestuarii TaxID=126333 RepID=UPI00351FB188